MPDGDMTADNSFTYTYDAENRIRSADVGGTYYCYIYDGNGLRVEKATASSSACSSPTGYELYWRNIGGNTIAETDGSGSTTNSSYNEYVFFGGRRIAQSNPSSSTVNYYFVDHLGSTRVVTTATGSACWEADYYPYGQEKTPASFSDTCSTHYKFTGYERDPETDPGNGTGNDYAFARYYSPRLGRFMSADPWGGDISDPQTLNKYAYTRNNPINMVDPTGMDGSCPYSTADVQNYCLGNTPGGSSGSGTGGGGDGDVSGYSNWGGGITGCDMGGSGFGESCSPTYAPAPPPPPPTPAQQKGKSTTPPPQNQSVNRGCLAKAAGSALLHGAIDAVALVPGAGTAAVAISTGVSIGDTIVEGDATDVEMTAAGSLLTLAAKPANALLIASYSARAAEAIPIAGTAVALFQLGYDGYKAFQQYQACAAGGN